MKATFIEALHSPLLIEISSLKFRAPYEGKIHVFEINVFETLSFLKRCDSKIARKTY
jgi:hypothetical protein